jgi:hypothetical protein
MGKEIKMSGTQAWVAPVDAARWIRRLLLAGVALSAIAVLSDLMEVSVISRAATIGITDAEADANDSRQQMIGILQVVLQLVTVIAFLVWFHRSHRNLSALGNERLKYTPGWAVGGFFVPFLNLVRPLQVMREIWHGSDPAGYRRDTDPEMAPAARDAQPTPPLVGLWWALFLITNALGRIIFRMAFNEDATLEELKTVSQLQVAADLIDIPSTLVLFILIGRIATSQSIRFRLASRGRPLPVEVAEFS